MRPKSVTTWTAIFGTAVFFAATGAWAGKPEPYAYSIDNEQVPFFDCSYFGMDFWILADWTYNEYGRYHYDKDGKLVKINGFFFNTDRRAYNSNDPSKAIEDGVNMVGATEHQHFVVEFDDEGTDVYYKESGISFVAIVPGYGRIALDAGTVAFQRVGDDWIPVKFTPNRSGPLEDWYPMCAILQ